MRKTWPGHTSGSQGGLRGKGLQHTWLLCSEGPPLGSDLGPWFLSKVPPTPAALQDVFIAFGPLGSAELLKCSWTWILDTRIS